MKTPVRPPKDSLRAPPTKRFYEQVAVAADENTHTVLLDGRAARTPKKAVLALPTAAAAAAVATEWHAQSAHIAPHTMPITRLANSAIDAGQGHEAAVSADLVKYAGSDLTLYRAAAPASLVDAQSRHWDPIVVWVEKLTGSRFVRAIGVMPVTQPPATLERVARQLAGLSAFEFACLHVITTLTGSALIALCCDRGYLTTGAAWDAANVDEDHQTAQWGTDEEAIHRRANRWSDMQAACRLLTLVRT